MIVIKFRLFSIEHPWTLGAGNLVNMVHNQQLLSCETLITLKIKFQILKRQNYTRIIEIKFTNDILNNA